MIPLPGYTDPPPPPEGHTLEVQRDPFLGIVTHYRHTENAMQEKIVTVQTGSATHWQGPESEAPKVGDMGKPITGDLISREAALAIFRPETSAVRKRICDDIRALPSAHPDTQEVERLRRDFRQCSIILEKAVQKGKRDEARVAELEAELAAQGAVTVAPLAEWHEDMGDKVWWYWTGDRWAGEPAHIGSPLSSDWPGYHTHFSDHPAFPAALSTAQSNAEGGAA